MNAYELADKLEWHWDNDCRSPAISKSIDMLRQQADRIADYERWEKRWSERVARAENRIAELEKELTLVNAKLQFMFEQEIKSARINR